MKSTQIEFQDFVSTLKSILKAKNLKYKDLAQLSSIPESTLKKILSGRDCSMVTMLEMCKAIDVNLLDIFELVRNKSTETYEFTEQQQEYFIDNYKAYKFFIRLYRKQPKKDLLSELKISPSQFKIYLKELEEVGLIERLENDQIRFIANGAIKIPESSRLHDRIVREVSYSFLEAIPTIKDSQRHKIHEVGSLQVSEENLSDFIQKLGAVFSEFEKKAQKDSKYLSQKNLQPITYLIAAARFDSAGK